MSYKDYLKQRIKELEMQIQNNQGHKDSLEKELHSLMMKEFEEDLREESEQKTLLQG